ncbi:hypothetical protein L228DRAFT_240605 [Xylona heveae TC161]|uniref:Zn(2)-C6 fungal-type domain-containing protein n=1 Tax=Xylona heveae (strain CBS 132557 / TC161) TaxID=1328760 RepID=A0A165FE63_XYLHT|nr:hypothetical protein L228DRAFT_240605 [Xylona heveae TC161]KZF20875.1 hypothetical protein L228DRAFT_240605 [Xylona heveae TC161]
MAAPPPTQARPVAPHEPSGNPMSNRLELSPAPSGHVLKTAIPGPPRRRSSKGAGPTVLKRAVSTPNVRALASADSSSLPSSADKRRNKLGYHRTSVACGHCRRRKIRCLLALDDPQGRCSNCIRLKKECNFFPVDQQPQERRQRTGSKIDAISAEASTSSSPSPTLATGPTLDQVGVFPQYSPVPLDSRQSMLSTSGVSGMASRTAPLVPRSSFDYASDVERAPQWETSPLVQQSPGGIGKQMMEEPSTSYWRLTDPAVATGFTPFDLSPSVNQPVYPSSSAGMFPSEVTGTESVWPMPTRSLSFDQVNTLPQVNSGFQPFRPSVPRRIPTDPPSLDTSNTPSTDSIGDPTSATMTAAPSSHPMQAFGYPTGWGGFPGHTAGAMARKFPDGFNGWYGDSAPLAQVQEEDSGPPYMNGVPPSFFPADQYNPG